jgi:hypothetical protein
MFNTLTRLAGSRARVTEADCVEDGRLHVLEDLETRTFLSAGTVLEAAAPAAAAAAPAINVPVTGATTVLPLTITGVVQRAGQLFAQGTLGTNEFEVPLTLSAEENPEDEDCPILNLEIGAIHLDLLGLQVDTSDICLRVTAEPGGGLLGDLLCGVANLLNDGTPLGNILGGLTGGQLTNLLDGITDLLNGALGGLTGGDAVSGVTQQQTGPGNGNGNGNVTNILNLSLGPVDLNLLGLDVELDDCEGGPVTVDITAERGPGRLLGNLLGGLSRLLDGDASQTAVDRLIGRIGRVIGNLLG